MDLERLCRAVAAAAADPGVPLPAPESCGEYGGLVALIGELVSANRRLGEEHQETIAYIRRKTDQLLNIIGTASLRPEELDERTLLQLDPIGVVAETFAQILEHQRATNQRLRRTRKQLGAVFESVDAGLMVLDRDFRIQACNTGFRKMFLAGAGSDPIGRYCRDIICRDSESHLPCSFKQMLTAGRSVRHYEWPYQDRYLSIVASPIKGEEGGITGGVLLYQDVTEQRRNKVELAEEKERLAITLRSIAEGVVTMDTADRIIMMNGVAEELTGWRQAEALGQPAEEIFWLVEQDRRNQAIRLSRELLAQPEPVDRTVHGILISREGEERLITASAAPIREAAGDVVGVVIVFRDITEERRLEREVMNARRLEAMGLLAGGIAHDFNNLLTGILGNTNLARKIAGEDNRAADRLRKAEQACLRAKDLTQQLLTFAKGGAPIRQVVSLAEILEETSQFALRGSNISCEFEIAADLWKAEVDEGQIGQVVQNLVINACQAMPQGGGITVRAGNVVLRAPNPQALPRGRYVRISVSDTGPGIPGEFLDRIFDPYFTTKQSGSGLGLASCYSIIGKHSGHISVDSRPGGGAIFTIFLPAAMAEPLAEKSGSEAEVLLQVKAKKILLMDDEEVVLELARDLAGLLGCEIVTARHGREAVGLYRQALADNAPFDVVIMDLTVPGGMGGREAMELLLEIDPEIRAIVSSGYSNDAVMASYRAHGFMGVVPKPYSAEDLVREINRVLQLAPEAGAS